MSLAYAIGLALSAGEKIKDLEKKVEDLEKKVEDLEKSEENS